MRQVLGISIRVFGLVVITSLFPMAVCAGLSSHPGAWLWSVPALAFLVIVTVGLRSENLMVRLSRSQKAPIGLLRSLERVALESSRDQHLPSLYIFKDPSVRFFHARGFFGRGALFLSQGFASQKSELELREALSKCLSEIRSPVEAMDSLTRVLVVGLLRLAPTRGFDLLQSRRWSRRGGLTPASALIFISLYSLAQLILFTGSASRKISALVTLAGQG